MRDESRWRVVETPIRRCNWCFQSDKRHENVPNPPYARTLRLDFIPS